MFCCISEYNKKEQSNQSAAGESLADKVVRAFCCNSSCLAWRLRDARFRCWENDLCS